MDIGLCELTDILSEAIAKLDQWLLEKSEGDYEIQNVSKSIRMQKKRRKERTNS